MANNLVEYLAQLKTKDPNRANWIFDCPNVGTNDFGFVRPKFVKEVIAGSRVRYDFKSAYSTNPTISPVLSRAKVTVTAIWIPTRLYVPALRDGVEVNAKSYDYSFPTINFSYNQVREHFNEIYGSATEADRPGVLNYGIGSPYIPANSIFTELGMWKPYFQPVGFAGLTTTLITYNEPEPKNAIPLLGYYDFIRNYMINTQQQAFIPLRVRGFSRLPSSPADASGYLTQLPGDNLVPRQRFDNLFQGVRSEGSSYPIGDEEGPFDISRYLKSFYNISSSTNLTFFAPFKKGVALGDGTFACYNDNHFGEFRAPYFSDYYTAFLSNENVEYERSTARVQTDNDGVITMEQIYSAQRVQNFIRRTIFKNSDYSEFIDAHYGVTPSTQITKPMFLGSVSTWLSFNDVIAQAQTSSDSNIENNTDLGSRASLGFGRMVTGSLRSNGDRPFVDFTAKEPGYFMVLEHIVPETYTWQGFDPIYDKRSLGSLYYPEYDKDGYQDKQYKYFNEQAMISFQGMPAGMPFQELNWTVAQEPAWWEYMASAGKMSGQMVDEGVYRNWVFSRDFEIPYNPVSRPSSDDAPNRSTFSATAPLSFMANLVYVQPEHYNHIFANTNGLDNIQTYYRHEYKVYQPLSHRFLSF